MATSPDFVQPKASPTTPLWRRYGGWVLVPLLLALLVLQVLVADRARLGNDPAWRPRIVALCGVLGCELPDWREPTAFHVTSRDVRPHPNAAGALLVTVTFRNDARFAQPWPRLQLTLANPEGDALGLRRFGPREYFGADPSLPRIGAGESATVSLAVIDPGKRAVSFEVGFHSPD